MKLINKFDLVRKITPEDVYYICVNKGVILNDIILDSGGFISICSIHYIEPSKVYKIACEMFARKLRA